MHNEWQKRCFLIKLLSLIVLAIIAKIFIENAIKEAKV